MTLKVNSINPQETGCTMEQLLIIEAIKKDSTQTIKELELSLQDMPSNLKNNVGESCTELVKMGLIRRTVKGGRKAYQIV